MMKKSEIDDRAGGFLLLLLFLLALHMLKGLFLLPEPDKRPCDEKVFVQVSGEMTRPGVYGFCRPPDLKDLLIKAGGLIPKKEKVLPSSGILYPSGACVDVLSDGKALHTFEGEMSAFYKVTFGIPISLNRETQEGLTAVPGIGPKIARAIAFERAERGGFKRLEDILSIRGIGPTVFRKIKPYLEL